MEESGQLHAPAALPPGEEPPETIGYEAGWAPESFWIPWYVEKVLRSYMPQNAKSCRTSTVNAVCQYIWNQTFERHSTRSRVGPSVAVPFSLCIWCDVIICVLDFRSLHVTLHFPLEFPVPVFALLYRMSTCCLIEGCIFDSLTSRMRGEVQSMRSLPTFAWFHCCEVSEAWRHFYARYHRQVGLSKGCKWNATGWILTKCRMQWKWNQLWKW
jgi:hypothetical protein